MSHSSRAVKPPQRHWETLREREVVVVGWGEGGAKVDGLLRETDRQTDRKTETGEETERQTQG